MYSELNINKESAILTFQLIQNEMPELYAKLELAMDQESFLNEVAARIQAEAIYDATKSVRAPGKTIKQPERSYKEVEMVIDVYRDILS